MAFKAQVMRSQIKAKHFSLKPLVATIRLLIAGGLWASAIAPVYAELPQPMPGGWVSPGGSATSQIDGNTLNIKQVTDKVILNWQSFNVGKANVVNFQQPDTSSIALNRINDQSPSRILGQINANGQVYLYNRNGFVFGKDSIINTNALIASTLNISNDVLEKGITQVFKPSEQGAAFGDRPDPDDASTSVNKDASIRFEKGLKTDNNGYLIDNKNKLVFDKSNKPILVDQGFNTNAQGQLVNSNGRVVSDKSGKPIIPVPVEAKVHVGKDGRIVIVAPAIQNDGVLSAENHGQIIMAASQDKVYLQAADKDSPFAGLVVEVDTGGKATNAGELLTKEGNITMAGFAVNQEGRIKATTSVNVNGSIRLVAQEKHSLVGDALVASATTRTEDQNDGLTKTSKLSFGKGSVTEIVPDADTTTAIDEQKQPQSYLEASAHSVDLKANASIKVTGRSADGKNVDFSGRYKDKGNLNITATDSPIDPSQGTKGRIFMDKSAKIDVSGVKGVQVAMARNVADISVQSYELRNSPLQLAGVLKGQTVKVDLRGPTKIIDTSGATARIKRDINERLTTGGKINLTSSGDIIVNSGANLDLTGGSVKYQDGYINTTKLIADNGRIVDIGVADPNLHYSGINGLVKEHNQKWGTTKVWDVSGKGRFEKGYIEGKNAGELTLGTSKLAWGGQLAAGFRSGTNQRAPGGAPLGGTFNIDLLAFQSTQNVRFQSQKMPLEFSNEPVNGEGPEFPKDKNGVTEELVLETALINNTGITNLSVKTWGDSTFDVGSTINMLPGGRLAVEAANITAKAGIKSPGGNISLQAAANSTYPQAGKVTLTEAAKLDVSGLWINDLRKVLAATPTEQLRIDGGNVKITGQGDVLISAGSSISADGGAWLSADRNLAAGKGGAISLAALGNSGTPSTLAMSGSLSAYGLSQGGSLSLSSAEIMVADSADALLSNPGNVLALAVKNGGFQFAPSFGFSKLSLEGNYAGVTVKSNVQLDLKTHNLFLKGNYQTKATGTSIRDFSSLVLLPEAMRKTQELNLSGKDKVVLEKGSAISLEKKSTVNMATAGSILVDGTVRAPAGQINLAINPLSGLEYDASQAIWLGSEASILVSGTSLMDPTGVLGQHTGDILDGGDVTLNAKRGYVILEKGALIDVSGSQGAVDIYQNTVKGKQGFKTVWLGSNAGSIAVTAAEGAVIDGNFTAKAGSAQQAAGSLQISLDRNNRSQPDEPKIPFPNSLLTIQVQQKDSQILSQDAKFGQALSEGLNGKLVLSSDEITNGGFANLSLATPGALWFSNSVDAKLGQAVTQVVLKTAESIKLDTPVIGWKDPLVANGNVILDSAYVQLGSTNIRDILDSNYVHTLPKITVLDPVQDSSTERAVQISDLQAATPGNAEFSAHAQWLGLVGASYWQGFSGLNLDSRQDMRASGLRFGDQRDYVGSLLATANLNLHASQLYPSTLSNYTFNTTGNINISGSNTEVSPLSAGGSLQFVAAEINQAGVVKAPLGTLNFTASKSLSLADGSVTSVSGKGQITPFGVIKGGLDWLYPLISSAQDLVDLERQASLQNLIFVAPPEKQLLLNAPVVTLAAGSKLDITGGGDVLATEFKPVSSEITDFLQFGSSAYSGSFAVLPTLGSSLAPYDPMLSVGWNTAPGKQVFLNGTDRLPTGNYTVLPAYYALLPGAFLITPQAQSTDTKITTFSPDGTPIVSGYFSSAQTGTRDARTGGFLVQGMAELLQVHPQYSVTCAGNCTDTFKDQAKNATGVLAANINSGLDYFSDKQKLKQTILTENFYQAKASANAVEAPLLPVDSGQISIIAQTKLVLEGDIDFAAYGVKAKGARMDIAADNIHVVKQLSPSPVTGVLEILDNDLNKLKVDSLFLGGARSFNADGSTDVAVSSHSITFDQGAKVIMADLSAAATEKVELKTDASLTAEGSVNTGDSQFNINGNGALLRVSADKQIILERTSADGTAGELIIAKGASLKADKSMLLDASSTTNLLGDVSLKKGTADAPSSLNLSANSVNIGEVGGLPDTTLNLSNQKLVNLSVDELLLNSRGTVSFYGSVGQVDANNNFIKGADGLPVPIVFNKLILNTAAISGFGDDKQVVGINANTLELANPYPDAITVAGTGQGSLSLSAKQFILGGGQLAVSGFSKVALIAEEKLEVEKSSQLQVAADVGLQAGYLTAQGGTQFKLAAAGHQLAISGGKVLPGQATGFGARMEFVADNVNFNSNVQLASGRLDLHALLGDVLVGPAAQIDLAGRALSFADAVAYTPGGTFNAVAEQGDVVLQAGASLDLRAGGGDAMGGNLVLSAPNQAVTLPDGINIQALGGSADLDIGKFSTASGFDQLVDKLSRAGINNKLFFRSRTDNIQFSAGKLFSANTITLAADQGAVDIFGQLSANASDQAGKVSIYAGDKLTLEAGSQLTATGAKGGEVLLSSIDGDTDRVNGLEVKSGALIDVSGAGSDNNGTVNLRALRTGAGINIQPIAGSVVGASKLLAEGVKIYGNADLGDDGEINDADIAAIKSDTDAYMSATNRVAVADALGHGATLMPGVEIDYSNDPVGHPELSLKSPWDLMDWRYNGSPGHLVIRASGNLNIDKNLTDGFKDETHDYLDAGVAKSVTIVDKLQSGESWSYQLTAGADLQSADANRTGSAANLVIGQNVMVRTGTGDIQLNAGADLSFTKAAAAVSKTISADAKTNVFLVADTKGWEVGAYLSGTGIAPGTKVAAIHTVSPVTKIVSAAVVKGATQVPVANTTGWAVGNYVTGTGLAAGTKIVSINSRVTNQVSASITTGSTVLAVQDSTGWKVGSILSGTGIRAGTTITAIDSTGKLVTISSGTTATIANNASISTVPGIGLNNPTTAALSTSTSIKTQSDVQISSATTNIQKLSSVSIKQNFNSGTVYSAGQATATDPYGTLGDGAVSKFFYSEYPVNGGDLTITAGANINGVNSGTDYNDWLLRIGDLSNSNLASRQPVAWGIGLGMAQNITSTYRSNTPFFQQNIGSFGGGNVAISAKGNISDLEVAIPTTGKQIAQNANPDSGNFSGFTDSNLVTRSQVQVNGGGNLLVNAGGNVEGGSYFLGKGLATIASQAQVTESIASGKLPVFYTGDAQLAINAVNGVEIAGVFDPMINHKSSNPSKADVNFFSYSDSSSVSIQSMAGDLLLAAQSGDSVETAQAQLAKVYPASLSATAFGGSVNLASDITLYPAKTSRLNVYAQQDITGAESGDPSAVYKLGMSDADLSLFPSQSAPAESVSVAMTNTANQISPYGLVGLVHAPIPLHTGDSEPARFVTLQGDIKDISINIPKKIVITAGLDVSNLALDAQNVNQDDVSIIEAGRDISYPSNRDGKTGALVSAPGKKLEIAGYGEVLVKAGRNIDLGSSEGLSSVGNAYNPNLSEQGADLTVIAGLQGAAPDYTGFITKYEKNYALEIQKAIQVITLFMQEYTHNNALNKADALQQFHGLPSAQTLPVQSKLNSLLLPVLFNEIKLAGTASAADKSLGNETGYAAIAAMFPDNPDPKKQWQGDLNLFFSKLQTQQGGDINLLVPGGSINAGLAVAFSGAKEASELGIVALRQGSINAVLKNDFLVNKSRVFALDSGNIMIWSSEGDIDAGKGAKSAISAPPASAVIDPVTGKIKFILPPVVQGSGIRTAASSADKVPGDVYLFAPKGVVDAGEAGIGGANVTISATAVLGANNIQFSGVGTGVPVASTGGLAAGLSGTSNLNAGVSQMAENSMAENTKSDKDKDGMLKDMVLGMLSVEVLGFGE